MLKKYKLKKELNQLYKKRDNLIKHLNNCVEISKFGYFTAVGMSQIEESRLELININKKISELEVRI